MVTGYEAEFYENIKQIRRDMSEIRDAMIHLSQYLNEKSITDDSVSKNLRRIADAMEDGKQ